VRNTQPREGCGQKARAEILERRRRAVEQLERRESLIVGEPDARGGKIERLAQNFIQLRREFVAGHKRGEQSRAHLG